MRIEDLTAQWLADALGTDTDRIRDIRYSPLGTGQVADTYRVRFATDGTAGDSAVLKVTASDSVSAATGARQGIYLREVRYYQVLAPDLGVSVPGCLHAEIDSAGADFALLLEDLAPCRPGDQLVGCTVEEAALALTEAAKLHAPWWNQDGLDNFAWLPQPFLDLAPDVIQALREAFDGFCLRYVDALDQETLDIGRTLFDRLPQYFAWHAEPPSTVQHGDFRPDNLLFDAAGGTRPVVVVDWQTVQRGPGMLDVSYFLGGSLAPAERRGAERELIEHYLDRLRTLGVHDYSFEDCWRDYIRFSFHGYFSGVFSAMFVERTERGDRMFTHMVRRAARHITDLDAIGLLR
ncbi:phosphotransferase family protein [Nocardia sp. NPDC056100]|uniref:phosphotransferase family protein n=1 Tax=Nocardia sp. NPDC056100 TaxID=3345712 RepID=UPI0035DB8BAD